MKIQDTLHAILVELRKNNEILVLMREDATKKMTEAANASNQADQLMQQVMNFLRGGGINNGQ